MKRIAINLAQLGIFALAGCNSPQGGVATLYRNSNLSSEMRIHFATFDAQESSNYYNLSNCQMVARVLNSNVRARSPQNGSQTAGFWCEPGPYVENGIVPIQFDAEFPSEAR